MKNIAIISSFDPINNEMISNINKYNDDGVVLYLCFLYSKYCSIELREKMIDIALKNKNIKYTFIDLLNKPLQFVDLKDFIDKMHDSGINDISLLIHDDTSYLVPEEKVINSKGKLRVNENAYDKSRSIRNLKNLDTEKEIIDFIVENKLYFMPLVEEYIKGKRYDHCVSVANTAYEIAISNKLEHPDQYFIAGLLHDSGKQAIDEESIDIMEKYFRNFVSMPKWSLHEFVGATYAQKLFPDINKECIKAIQTHATGDENMSKMQKIIYASDKIEPTRGYDSQYMIDACKKDYDRDRKSTRLNSS